MPTRKITNADIYKSGIEFIYKYDLPWKEIKAEFPSMYRSLVKFGIWDSKKRGKIPQFIHFQKWASQEYEYVERKVESSVTYVYGRESNEEKELDNFVTRIILLTNGEFEISISKS